MPNTPEYAEAVKQTFRSKALRTVLIIDDQFPTYADLFPGGSDPANFKEIDRALELYKLFKIHNMPCDVENQIGDLATDVERIRKSDLIVLDYHLTPGDPTKSIDLVQRLAATKHFNTVVLYTREDLGSVWLNLACSLRGGWEQPDEVLASDPEILEQWENISDDEKDLLSPTAEFIGAHVLGGVRGWPPKEGASLRKQLQATGVHAAHCTMMITALIHRTVIQDYSIPPSARGSDRYTVVGEISNGGPQWLQARNCFVALLGKKDDEDTGHPTDATRILDCLDAAFMAWHPNLIQVLTSEIQNILELEALATDQEELRDPATHTGLSYYLLDALEDGSGPDAPEQLAGPLQTLIDKIVETLRHKLVADEQLRSLGTTILSEELRELNWPEPRKESKAAVFTAAARMTRSRGSKAPAKNDALFALNSFLSTEEFRRRHLTTGTVFRRDNDAGAEYWVCASPSCDMVDRLPSLFQTWARSLHPLRPMIGVRLHPVRMQLALSEAHLGRYAFVSDQQQLAFSVVDTVAQQPVYEIFFAEDAGKWIHNAAGGKSFRAFRVSAGDGVADRQAFTSEEFLVVGQFRPSYATRVLHTLGQHLSRVGLDFVDMPE